MSIALLQNATACAPGLTVPFQAVGGTGPYTYVVVPGGVGGSIDSTGIYTAPLARVGTDTIRATDSLAAVVTGTILVGTPLELFCNVLQTAMGLTANQVYLWDQKIDIPKDSRLYIAVGVLSCKPFASNTSYNGSGSGLDATQSVNMSATLSVDAFSRGPEARNRKEEIILALNSFYSEQQQELNSFRIFPLSKEFVNLSEVDGAAIPYRFNLSVNIQYFVKSTQPIQYFSDFQNTQIVTDP
jgi:hypothetical protein